MLDRQMQIIHLFIKNSMKTLSSDEISEFINVSNRTVRNDIHVINSNFMDNIIISVKSKGYLLNTTHYTLDAINERYNHIQSYKEKIMLSMAYQLLMHNRTHTIQQLEQDYLLSKTVLNDYFVRIQQWCQKFNIDLAIKKKQGIIVNGSNNDITNAIIHLNQLSTGHGHVEDLILGELPEAHQRMIAHIIQETLEQFGIETSEIQIRQLLIHLILIIKRQQQLNEIDSLNHESTLIAQSCIKQINNRLGYNLSSQITNMFSFFIGYHFNKLDLGIERIFIQSYIDRLIELMQKRIHVPFSDDTILQQNLYDHFSKAYLRITQNIYLNNPLVTEIKKLYPYVFNTLFEAINKLNSNTDIEMNEDEIAFLTIHFQAAIERRTKAQLNAVIVCYYGLGVSNFLETKINKLTDELTVINTIRLENISNHHFENVDLLITTHDIPRHILNMLPSHIITIKVSPLFSEDDHHKIMHLVKQKQNPIQSQHHMSAVNFLVVNTTQSLQHTVQIFEEAHKILQAHHAITDGYIETALEREKSSSTYIGNYMAIPHGDPEKVLQSHVLIFRTKDVFPWRQHDVKLIFFLAISPKDNDFTKQMMQLIASFDEDIVNHLCSLDDFKLKQQLLQYMQE
ncbi:TPA: transcription antiterminator [Staphylococcus argenteus]|uniref:Transcriptional regulator (Antiterminator) n=1 Tax=Staphylococcus argenteus TaxID=985002 RepID=A0A7U7JRZ2_9STAP|nr:PRD domain-containing protein [Staphylococcus argenteus]BBN31057.1 transcription antiterminator, BglG family [Staphylococcus aureus]ATY58078.1 PTS mannose transporter subunit IIA [Staphylococcus argenteus]ATZ88302.1 PTS mannose transporter subunit IIA [Staphylococcus argenteus]EKF1504295.1 PRD domain-containing protein [Staphylococcus argenteus]EYG88852.1 BglG family transcriptional antiterminator [Staphylococcus argenteus]